MISLHYIFMISLYDIFIFMIFLYDIFIWYPYMIYLYDISIWYFVMYIYISEKTVCYILVKACESNVYNYPSRVSPNHIPVICVSNHVVHCCQSYVKASDEQPKGFSWKGRASTVATHQPSFFYRLSDIDFRL
jgi:hypothetical protein